MGKLERLEADAEETETNAVQKELQAHQLHLLPVPLVCPVSEGKTDEEG